MCVCQQLQLQQVKWQLDGLETKKKARMDEKDHLFWDEKETYEALKHRKSEIRFRLQAKEQVLFVRN